jgi:hypothetical protein
MGKKDGNSCEGNRTIFFGLTFPYNTPRFHHLFVYLFIFISRFHHLKHGFGYAIKCS